MNFDDMTLPEIAKEIKKRGEEIARLCRSPKKAKPAPIKQTASPVKYTKINATIDGVDYGAEVLS